MSETDPMQGEGADVGATEQPADDLDALLAEYDARQSAQQPADYQQQPDDDLSWLNNGGQPSEIDGLRGGEVLLRCLRDQNHLATFRWISDRATSERLMVN